MGRRSVTRLQPGDFDRLGPHLDLITTKKISPEQAAAAHRVFIGGLLNPGATNPELSTLAMLSQQVGVHLNYGMERLAMHPAEFPGQAEVHPLLFDTFREGDPDTVAAVLEQMTDVGENAALMIAQQLQQLAARPRANQED
jgi:hypothetical protein